MRGGQTTLSFVLLVSGVIIEIAIAGSFITYFLSSSGLGDRLSARAFAAAEAGVRDVQIKVSRDKEFVSGGTTSYVIPVGGDTVAVLVSRDASDPANYLYTATSTGMAVSRNRQLVVVIAVDRTTGLTQLQSLSEKAF